MMILRDKQCRRRKVVINTASRHVGALSSVSLMT